MAPQPVAITGEQVHRGAGTADGVGLDRGPAAGVAHPCGERAAGIGTGLRLQVGAVIFGAGAVINSRVVVLGVEIRAHVRRVAGPAAVRTAGDAAAVVVARIKAARARARVVDVIGRVVLVHRARVIEDEHQVGFDVGRGLRERLVVNVGDRALRDHGGGKCAGQHDGKLGQAGGESHCGFGIHGVSPVARTSVHDRLDVTGGVARADDLRGDAVKHPRRIGGGGRAGLDRALGTGIGAAR